MNFLAHALLSGDDPDILLGNLMVDFLQAGEEAPQNPLVRRGIERHYRIDRFTDSHPLVAQSRGRLFPKYRHYSAVLVDVFYDHLLATNWDKFCALALGEFAAQVYRVLETRRAECPPRMAKVTPALISDDWLNSYAHPDGVLQALARLQERSRRAVDLSASWPDFEAEIGLYEAEFLEFFPQIFQLRLNPQNPEVGSTRNLA